MHLSTQVPAFVYSPSHIPEELWGTEYRGLMHVADWIPTVAAAADFGLSGRCGRKKEEETRGTGSASSRRYTRGEGVACSGLHTVLRYAEELHMGHDL